MINFDQKIYKINKNFPYIFFDFRYGNQWKYYFFKKDPFLEILEPKTGSLSPFLEIISSRISIKKSSLKKLYFHWFLYLKSKKYVRTSVVKIGFPTAGTLVLWVVMVFVIFVQLEGYRGNSTIPVHVFVSNEKGQIKPHIFFRSKFIWNFCAFFIWNFLACKIASRNSTPCDDDEFILNGQRTDAIRINLSPKDDFTAIVDCVGILKLRNAGNFSYLKFSKFFFMKFWIIYLKNIKDVENESKSKSQPKPKRRNPTVRLAFHALIPNTDPSQPDLPLMVASNPISCSQPEGQPEILRMSSLLGNPEGGDEVFIIGKL